METCICPECGEPTSLIAQKANNFECTCQECAATWLCDSQGAVINPSQGRTLGQRTGMPVLASMNTRSLLNSVTEEWGELGKKLDPGLLKFNPKGANSYFNPLPIGIGQNSRVADTTVKSAAATLKMLTSGEISGAVFKVDGNDIVAVWNAGDGRYIIKEAPGAPAGIKTNWPNYVRGDGELYQFVNQFNKAYKGRVTASVVHKDAQRAGLQNDRGIQKQGSPYWGRNRSGGYSPVDVTGAKFKEEARYALYSRLKEYKATNAHGVNSPEELLAFVKQKGFLSPLKIGQIIYDLNRTQVDIDKVKKSDEITPGSWDEDGVTVEYQYSDQNERTWYSYGRNEGEEAPPRVFKVKFKLEGGSIVPSEVYDTGDTHTDRPPKRYGASTAPAEPTTPREESINRMADALANAAIASIYERGNHKAGCKCGFCMNKGGFGKKKAAAKETGEAKKDGDKGK